MSVTIYKNGKVIRVLPSRPLPPIEERLGITREELLNRPIPESVIRLRETLARLAPIKGTQAQRSAECQHETLDSSESRSRPALSLVRRRSRFLRKIKMALAVLRRCLKAVHTSLRQIG